MTRQLSVLTALTLALFAGCDTTDVAGIAGPPTESQFTGHVQAASVLRVEGLVWEREYNAIDSVNGMVSYTIQYDDGSNTSYVAMSTRGAVEPLEGWGPVWTFGMNSVASVTPGDSFTLRMALEGRSDRAVLVLIVSAGVEELTLNSMRLEFPPRYEQ